MGKLEETIKVLERLINNPDTYGIYGETAKAFGYTISILKRVADVEGIQVIWERYCQCGDSLTPATALQAHLLKGGE